MIFENGTKFHSTPISAILPVLPKTGKNGNLVGLIGRKNWIFNFGVKVKGIKGRRPKNAKIRKL